MRFEWDPEKARKNLLKHGVAFADATAVFSGPVVQAPDVRRDYGENRWITVGAMGGAVVVVIVTTHRGEIVRLISARRASRKERANYYEAIKTGAAEAYPFR